MEYTGDPRFADIDGQWIVEGPNSGGVTFYMLWREHMFRVEQDFGSGSVGSGVPVAEFLAAYRGTDDPRYRPIVEDLERRLSGAPPAPVTQPPAISDLGTLNTLLLDAQARRDWPGVVTFIQCIVELERDNKRLAAYYHAMALIQRDELADPGAALTSLENALDADPSMLRAFETQCTLLTKQRDWKSLERAHRKMIVRVRGQDAALEFNLYRRLAEIYRDHLDSAGAAIASFKAALALRPDDPDVLAALQALDAG